MGLGGKQGSCLQDTLQVHPCTQSTRYAHGAGPRLGAGIHASDCLANSYLTSLNIALRRGLKK